MPITIQGKIENAIAPFARLYAHCEHCKSHNWAMATEQGLAGLVSQTTGDKVYEMTDFCRHFDKLDYVENKWVFLSDAELRKLHTIRHG